jgi:hypothetical protein
VVESTPQKRKAQKDIQLNMARRKTVRSIPVPPAPKSPPPPAGVKGKKTFWVQIVLIGGGLRQYHNVAMPTGALNIQATPQVLNPAGGASGEPVSFISWDFVDASKTIYALAFAGVNNFPSATWVRVVFTYD